MIKKIELENYKGFENFTINDLERVSLIGGMNNIGKTSLLEAIFMFYDRYNINMMLSSFGWRGMPSFSSTADSLWKPLFNNYDLSKDFVIAITDSIEKQTLKCKTKYLKSNGIPLNNNINLESLSMSPADNNSHLGLEAKFTSNISKNKEVLEFTLNNGLLNLTPHGARHKLKQTKYLPSNILLLHDDAIVYGKIDKIGKEKEVLEVLQIIEPRLKSLSVISTAPQMSLIYGDIGLAEKVPISCMGDGIRRILSIIVKIVSNENGLVLIDEIENGLHYSIMSDIWKGIAIVAEKVNCQVISTTHSYECLQAACKGNEDYKNNFSYIRLEKNDKNEISAKTLSHEILETALENSWEVR